MIWGNVIKEKPVQKHEGFGLYFGDTLFNGESVIGLSTKYANFAVVT
jgi:hypothetical protein